MGQAGMKNNWKRNTRYMGVFAVLAAVFCMIVVLNINTGNVQISVPEILRILFLKKGTQVYVCGDVYADVFQKDDGSHIPSVSLTVSRIELLGKAEKKENGDGTATGQPQ